MIRGLLAGAAAGAFLVSSPVMAQAITEVDVFQAQQSWAEGIVAIGEAYAEGGDYRAVAEELVDTLYAYGEGGALFKPTKASEQPFRLTGEQALSYFVSGMFEEDEGFALQPWSAVHFENARMLIGNNSATAMGNYYFTDADTGEDVRVEYTFGYIRDADGNLVINVHHSSLPYDP